MNSQELEALNQVKIYLGQSYDSKQVESLIIKYQGSIKKWIHEYLVTCSHLTPEDFADEIKQAELFR